MPFPFVKQSVLKKKKISKKKFSKKIANKEIAETNAFKFLEKEKKLGKSIKQLLKTNKKFKQSYKTLKAKAEKIKKVSFQFSIKKEIISIWEDGWLATNLLYNDFKSEDYKQLDYFTAKSKKQHDKLIQKLKKDFQRVAKEFDISLVVLEQSILWTFSDGKEYF